MKNLFAQLELDYSSQADHGRAARNVRIEEEGQRDSAETLGFGRFSGYSFEYAQNARMAGRILSASVSDDELRGLLNERQALLDKKFAGTMTKKEGYRLQYIRWSLDRVEDAKYGPTLDLFDQVVSKYEHFLTEVKAFEEDLRAAVAKPVNENEHKRSRK